MAIANVVERNIRYYSPLRQPVQKLEVKATDIVQPSTDKNTSMYMGLTPSGISSSYKKRKDLEFPTPKGLSDETWE
jgi:hypothetical protein